jgi:hypothetical protein
MALYLAALPLWISGLLLVGLTTILSMLGPVLVRRYIPLERLSTNNEVAGFKFAVVGVIYAVLIAFAVIVVWERFSDAESAVTQEAGATAALYRLADGVGAADGGEAIHSRLTAYLRATIDDDWPAMGRDEASPAGTRTLNALYAAVLSLTTHDNRETAILSEFFYQLDLVTQSRRKRILLASGIVPDVVWAVLLAGAVVTISFTFFFGTENLRAQSLMAGLLSLIIFMGLHVIIVIDYPFTGSVHVTPEALELVLKEFAAKP